MLTLGTPLACDSLQTPTTPVKLSDEEVQAYKDVFALFVCFPNPTPFPDSG